MQPLNTVLNATPHDGTDDELHALLGCWPGVQPEPGFDAAVWRRIRMCRQPGTAGISTMLEALRVLPAWPMAVAASVLLVFGMWLGGLVPRGPRHSEINHPLLHPRTVAGAYLSLATGGGR